MTVATLDPPAVHPCAAIDSEYAARVAIELHSAAAELRALADALNVNPPTTLTAWPVPTHVRRFEAWQRVRLTGKLAAVNVWLEHHEATVTVEQLDTQEWDSLADDETSVVSTEARQKVDELDQKMGWAKPPAFDRDSALANMERQARLRPDPTRELAPAALDADHAQRVADAAATHHTEPTPEPEPRRSWRQRAVDWLSDSGGRAEGWLRRIGEDRGQV